MFGSRGERAIAGECNGESNLGSLTVEVAHALPGRLRLRIAELKDRSPLVRQLTSYLGSLENLRSFEMNPRAGSVVIHYDPTAQAAFANSLQTLFPRLTDWTPSRPGHERGRNSRQPSDLASQITRLFSQANEGVDKAMGGIDLKVLIPVALVALSVLGIIVGAARQRKVPVPTWYDLLWFAFNTFVILNLTMSSQKNSKLREEPTDPKAESV